MRLLKKRELQAFRSGDRIGIIGGAPRIIFCVTGIGHFQNIRVTEGHK